MVTETFREMLFKPESENLDELPSPESLKYRILISTKPPKAYLEAGDDDDSLIEDKDCKVWTIKLI